jgi:hypothetical protein
MGENTYKIMKVSQFVTPSGHHKAKTLKPKHRRIGFLREEKEK